MKPTVWMLALLTGALLVGCASGEVSKTEEQKMKNSLAAGDGEFDINKVPPEHREMVRGFMEQSKAGQVPQAPPDTGKK